MSLRLYGTISGCGRSAGAVIPTLGSGRYSPGPNIVLPSWLKGSDPHFTITVFGGQPGALATVSPYRVFQLLETDAQVDGLFRCVRAHLAPGATCILNVVHIHADPETLRQEWGTTTGVFRWEVAIEGGRLRCDERRPRMDPERRILYPELIYRRFQGNTWIEEVVLKIPRRCYAPEEFAQVICSHGFQI